METYQTFQLGDENLRVRVRRSRRAKKIRIDVGLKGVTVVLPRSSGADPADVLQRHADWVHKQRSRVAQYRDDIPDRTFADGALWPFLGKSRPLRLVDASTSGVTDDTFRLSRDAVDRSSIRDVLASVYREAARDHFTRRAEAFSREMDAPFEQIQVRNQKTRWGSFSPRTGTLSLNWRLMMAPPDVVDYVLVHELAHHAHPNHSDRFWSRVAQFDPDYAVKEAWLKANGTQLVFDPERWA